MRKHPVTLFCKRFSNKVPLTSSAIGSPAENHMLCSEPHWANLNTFCLLYPGHVFCHCL